MSVWYEVKVTTTQVYAVEMEHDNVEEVENIVIEEITYDYDDIVTNIITGDDIDRCKRHADEVFGL